MEINEVPQQDAPTYLGDGLYVDYDGWQVRLFAHNGVSATNEVFLDPDVLEAFLRFAQTKRQG